MSYLALALQAALIAVTVIFKTKISAISWNKNLHGRYFRSEISLQVVCILVNLLNIFLFEGGYSWIIVLAQAAGIGLVNLLYYSLGRYLYLGNLEKIVEYDSLQNHSVKDAQFFILNKYNILYSQKDLESILENK